MQWLWIAGLAFAFGCGAVTDDTLASDAGADAPPGVARLSGLTAAGLTLVPEFDPAVTEYTVAAPFFFDQIVLTPDAPADHFIRVQGSLNDPAEPADPIALPLGGVTATIEVSSFGLTSTTYTIEVARGRDVLEYVKASNTGENDAFGCSIAIDGDLLAVGAFGEDSGSASDQNDDSVASAGAVYLFARDGVGAWSQEAYIKPEVIGRSDGFGRLVDLSGETLVVTSIGEDSTAVGINGDAGNDDLGSSGAAYVFVRDGGNWTQQAYIKASNTSSGDSFGASVAIDGDTLVVGAANEDSAATGVGGGQDDGASGSGAAYVFVRDSGAWSQQAYLKASNTDASDVFGVSVAISGDTVAIGASGEDSSASGIDGDEASNDAGASGAVYIFVRDGALWSQQAYIKASNTDPVDSFGSAVALAGDTLAVGAPAEDSAATGIDGNQASRGAITSGAVYVFARSDDRWSQQAYLKASNTQPLDSFGMAVDLDGDRLVVSAPGEDSGASGLEGDQANNSISKSGAAYVFVRDGARWRQTTYLKASNPGSPDEFGGTERFGVSPKAVGVSRGTIVVGAPRESGSALGLGGADNDDAAFAGAVYVFE